MGNIDDHIKNTFDGGEIPFNPDHWEQLKERLNQADAPTSFEEGAKNIFDAAEVPAPNNSWEQFEQKLIEAQATPFEKAVKDKFASAEIPYNENHWENISNKINNPSSAFEQKTKDILNSQEIPYDAKHWEQMEKMLAESDRKVTGGFFTWKNIAAGAALVLLGWITYAALNNNSDNNKTAGNNTSATEQEIISKSKTQQNDVAANTAEKINNEKKSNTAVITTATQNNVIEKSISNSAKKVEKHNINSNNTVKSKKTNYSKLHKKSLASNHTQSNEAESAATEKNNEIGNFKHNAAKHLQMNEANISFKELALSDKNLIAENDNNIDSLESPNIASDWNGMIFKYATLPSSLPTSVLTNIWEQPAIAGIDGRTAVKVMYNSPWQNLLVNRTTGEKQFSLLQPSNMYVSVDGSVGKDRKLGIGAYYYNTSNNNWQSNNFNVTLSYTHSFDKFTQLRGGIGATYTDNALNTNNINFWQNTQDGAMLVANDQSVNNPERYINYKAGLWFNHPLVFAGLTFDNLFQTTVTKKADLQLSSSAIAGVNIPFTKKFTATAYFKRVSTISDLYTFGTMMSFSNKIFAGVSYENSNYATVTVGCNIKDQIRLHLSAGILANVESLYINDTNQGFVTAGVRYLIEPSKKLSGPSL